MIAKSPAFNSEKVGDYIAAAQERLNLSTHNNLLICFFPFT